MLKRELPERIYFVSLKRERFKSSLRRIMINANVAINDKSDVGNLTFLFRSKTFEHVNYTVRDQKKKKKIRSTPATTVTLKIFNVFLITY